MPPKIKITEEDIIEAAFQMVRENGVDALNARDLAQKLNCSVHPIFRNFSTMEALRQKVYEVTEQFYNEHMIKAGQNEADGFLGMGLAYIEFAKNDRYLFRFLFMSDAFHDQNIADIAGTTEGDEEILEMLSQRTGLTRKSAQELYTGIWLTTHGIASMYATNHCRFSDEENKRMLNNAFMGLLMKLKNEEETHK